MIAFVVVSSSLIPLNAHATEVNLAGAVVTWKDKLYQADGCSNYDFDWYNGVGQRLLQFKIIISDPYGRQLEDADKIGVEPGTRGVFTLFICKSAFKAGLGPYTLKVYIEDYSGGFGSRQTTKDFFFSEIPGSSGIGASPSSTPNVTVTARPVPAPTVTVTATPASDDFFKNEASRLQTEFVNLKIKYDVLSAKLKRICSSKPKPKGC